MTPDLLPTPETPVAALAFAYLVWAIAGSGQDIIAKGFVLLLAGIPIYVGMRWWQQREAGPAAVDVLPPVVDGAATEPGEVRIAALAGAGHGERGHDA